MLRFDGHKMKRIKRSRRENGGASDDGAALLRRRSAVDARSLYPPALPDSEAPSEHSPSCLSQLLRRCFSPNPLLVLGGDGNSPDAPWSSRGRPIRRLPPMRARKVEIWLVGFSLRGGSCLGRRAVGRSPPPGSHLLQFQWVLWYRGENRK